MATIPGIDVEFPRETGVVVGLISGSQFVNHTYLVLFPPILSVLATDFGVGLSALGLALGVQGATNTLFQLPFGYLADNYDRTVALGLSSLLGALGVFVVALAPTFAWLVVGQAVIGIGVAGHHPSHYPLIADATPEGLRGRAFSVYGFGGSLGFAAPPAFIAGVISFPGLTWRHAVGAIGAVGLVYAVLVTLLVSRRVPGHVTEPNLGVGSGPAGREGGLATRIRAELRALAASPGVIGMALIALFSSTASWGFTSYVVVLLTETYAVGLDVANLALTASFAVGAVAILVGGDLSDRYAPGPVIVGSFLALVALFALVGSGVVPATAALALVLAAGAVRSLAGPARSKLTDALSPDDAVGKSFAAITVGIMLGSAIAPPAFGYLIESRGLAAAFFAIAAVALLSTVVAAAVVARYGRREAGDGTAG